jgi:hypothetical protein
MQEERASEQGFVRGESVDEPKTKKIPRGIWLHTMIQSGSGHRGGGLIA